MVRRQIYVTNDEMYNNKRFEKRKNKQIVSIQFQNTFNSISKNKIKELSSYYNILSISKSLKQIFKNLYKKI